MNEKDDDQVRREPRLTEGVGALPGAASAVATPAQASRTTGASASVPHADWERGLLEKLLSSTLEEQRTARRWRIFFRFAAPAPISDREDFAPQPGAGTLTSALLY
jgi:hypothetical protein